MLGLSRIWLKSTTVSIALLLASCGGGGAGGSGNKPPFNPTPPAPDSHTCPDGSIVPSPAFCDATPPGDSEVVDVRKGLVYKRSVGYVPGTGEAADADPDVAGGNALVNGHYQLIKGHGYDRLYAWANRELQANPPTALRPDVFGRVGLVGYRVRGVGTDEVKLAGNSGTASKLQEGENIHRHECFTAGCAAQVAGGSFIGDSDYIVESGAVGGGTSDSYRAYSTATAGILVGAVTSADSGKDFNPRGISDGAVLYSYHVDVSPNDSASSVSPMGPDAVTRFKDAFADLAANDVRVTVYDYATNFYGQDSFRDPTPGPTPGGPMYGLSNDSQISNTTIADMGKILYDYARGGNIVVMPTGYDTDLTARVSYGRMPQDQAGTVYSGFATGAYLYNALVRARTDGNFADTNMLLSVPTRNSSVSGTTADYRVVDGAALPGGLKHYAIAAPANPYQVVIRPDGQSQEGSGTTTSCAVAGACSADGTSTGDLSYSPARQANAVLAGAVNMTWAYLQTASSTVTSTDVINSLKLSAKAAYAAKDATSYSGSYNSAGYYNVGIADVQNFIDQGAYQKHVISYFKESGIKLPSSSNGDWSIGTGAWESDSTGWKDLSDETLFDSAAKQWNAILAFVHGVASDGSVSVDASNLAKLIPYLTSDDVIISSGTGGVLAMNEYVVGENYTFVKADGSSTTITIEDGDIKSFTSDAGHEIYFVCTGLTDAQCKADPSRRILSNHLGWGQLNLDPIFGNAELSLHSNTAGKIDSISKTSLALSTAFGDALSVGKAALNTKIGFIDSFGEFVEVASDFNLAARALPMNASGSIARQLNSRISFTGGGGGALGSTPTPVSFPIVQNLNGGGDQQGLGYAVISFNSYLPLSGFSSISSDFARKYQLISYGVSGASSYIPVVASHMYDSNSHRFSSDIYGGLLNPGSSGAQGPSSQNVDTINLALSYGKAKIDLFTKSFDISSYSMVPTQGRAINGLHDISRVDTSYLSLTSNSSSATGSKIAIPITKHLDVSSVVAAGRNVAVNPLYNEYESSNFSGALELAYHNSHSRYVASVGALNESAGALGSVSSGLLGMSASTVFASVGLEHSLTPSLSVSAYYTRGISNLSPTEDAVWSNFSQVQSSAYSLGFNLQNFGPGSLSASVSAPITIRGGFGFTHEDAIASLAPTGQQRNYSIQYGLANVDDKVSTSFGITHITQPGNLATAPSQTYITLRYSVNV